MSYGNRSKEYDWFKGGNNNKKSPKSTAKTIWRFTKIFLMFSLFFFSMWGCVQVFIIKTNNRVGNGVEFYNSEDEIAPHVTQFKVTKDAKGIYFINTESENVWLNKDQNPAELKAAQDVLKKGGHKLSDAFKGTNEYARVIKADGSVDKAQVVALSSEQTKYQGTANNFAAMTIYNGNVGYALPAATTARAQFAMALLHKLDDASGHLLTTKPAAASIDASKNAFKVVVDYLRIYPKDQNSIVNVNPVDPKTAATTAKANNGKWAYDSKGNQWYKSNGTAWTSSNAPNMTVEGPKLTGTTYRPIITWGQAWKRGVGPFYGLFVWPIAKMGVAITNGMGMHHGWESLFAIVIIVFILRLFAFGLTFKSVLQQTKQQEVQAKKAVIDAKYANYKGNKQMESRKRQETAELYKKEGISPLGAIGTIFITMPIFLSIWRVIGGVPHLKSTVWLGINFSSTSYKELFAGEWQYLPLILLAAASAAFSQIYPRLLTKRRDKNRINVHQKQAMKKNNKTQNIILVVYVIMAVIFSAGIQIYWIVGGIWQVIQATITHHVLIRNRKKAKNRVKV